ncbi:MAG TPA: alpha/beta hydrolase [Kofleriaceae bacterium]|jgi:pimeloyl-ACP methyl ester carboxylesterase|nr:alpha/beta hydrolase [Kofleriaceae bacterium]
MPQIDVNGIQLEYEVSGDPAAPPVLLIMGLGAQLTRWPEPFHRGLSDAGFRVIRYDNRDVGRSTRLTQLGVPSLPAAALRAGLGLPVRAPYDLGALTADAVGLLDALGIRSAHVVGASMGGMIAQMLAANHAGRVRALVSIMSSSGHRGLPQPSLGLRLALIRRPGPRASRAEVIDATAARLTRLAGRGYPPDPQLLREQIAADFDRGYYPAGVGRQLLAILASGSRAPILGRIAAPTLIQHGADDPLIPVAAAHDLHRRIRGSRLELFPGMGHDLPRALVPALTGQIIEHVRRADAATPAGQVGGSAVS